MAIRVNVSGGGNPAVRLGVSQNDFTLSREAEAWAVGTRNGVAVAEGDPAYHNNAKYYADNAQPIDDTAGIGDTGKVWSADKSATEVGTLKSAIDESEYIDDASGLTELAFTRGTLRTDGTTSEFNKESRIYTTRQILFPYGGKIDTPAYIYVFDYTTNTLLTPSMVVGKGIIIPAGANIRFQLTTTPNNNTSNSTENIIEGLNIERYNRAIETIKASVDNIIEVFDTGILEKSITGYTLGYRHGNASVVTSANTAVTNNLIALKAGDRLVIAEGYKLFWCYQNGQYPSGSAWQTGEYIFPVTGSVYIELRKTDNSNITVPVATLDSVVSVESVAGILVSSAYVSTDGNDNNVGTENDPYATISKAVSSGAKYIYIKGGIYTETIDLSKASGQVNFINCDPTLEVIVKAPNNIVITNAVIHTGSIYKATVTVTPAANNKWMYQEGVADENTLISDAERLPQQRGREYRCPETLIVKCDASTLSDALSEMAATTDYKWYLDSDTLYFTAPSEPSTSKPICYSPGTSLFANIPSRLTINAYGIEAMYHSFNISKTVGSNIVYCKASNVYGAGAFRYDQCNGVTFRSCEASRCVDANYGDGFNGHGVNSGDIYAYQVTASLIDCWSHDNSDDGYSDHERSEIVIDGGLFEYNGKAGVTPSYGSHCVCKNVYSRQNYAGFWYVGTAETAEGGKYGQMLCYDCVAENNRRGGTQTGFRCTGNGNTALLVNCKSINNTYAIGTDNSGGRITLIDLGIADNDNKVDGYATRITVKNTGLYT